MKKSKWNYLFATVIGIIFLFPILWMIRVSLLPDHIVIQPHLAWSQSFSLNFHFSNYLDVFKRVPFLSHLWTSILFCVSVVFLGLFINSSCAYAFARLPMRGKSILFSLIVSLIIIPFEALVIPLFLLLGVKCQLTNSLPGLFLPYMVKAFNIFFLHQYFLSLPKELEEAARVDGASWFRIYFFIALPLARPALVTCALLDFAMHWSEYLWPLVMTNQSAHETLQIGLGHFYTLPPIVWGDIMAYSVLATLPMLILFIFMQRFVHFTFMSSGIK